MNKCSLPADSKPESEACTHSQSRVSSLVELHNNGCKSVNACSAVIQAEPNVTQSVFMKEALSKLLTAMYVVHDTTEYWSYVAVHISQETNSRIVVYLKGWSTAVLTGAAVALSIILYHGHFAA